jgi:hypothetical protein
MFALEALEAERILSKPGEGTLVRMHRRASRVLEAFIDESIRVSVRAQHHPTIFQGMRYRHGTLEAIERLMRGGEIESGLRS